MPAEQEPIDRSQGVARLILPDVQNMIEEGEWVDVKETLENLHPADVAEILEHITPEEAARVFRLLDLEDRADTLEHLEEDDQVRLVEKVGVDAVAPAVEEMAPDDRADLIKALPEEAAEELLDRLSGEERKDVQTLVAYPEGTAGSIMSTDFAAIGIELTAAAAIEALRRQVHESETVYSIFAIDDEGRLAGIVPLEKLVFAAPEKRVAELSVPCPTAVHPEDDQEQVARVIQKYDLLGVPVTDADGRIVGIVTQDDVMDVLEEEATEDAQRMAAVAPLDTPYFHARFLELVRKRGGWLVVLFLAEMFTGTAMRHFEDVLSRALALMFFVPLVISSGGNSGSQSATLITRGLAVGDVTLRDWWRISVRELLVGATLGLFLGLVGFGRAMLWGTSVGVGIVVGLTLITVVAVMTTVGGMLPLILKRVGFDPAIASSPFVASLADVSGVLIYLSMASALLAA
ncbi:MAG: magnesium transporter [Planctomycetes bacterium]|nr:magnesium transporter [Planctomycetota bacterium]